MQKPLKKITAVMLASLLSVSAQPVAKPLPDLVNSSYLELMTMSADIKFPASEYNAVRKSLEAQRRAETERLKKDEKDLDQRLKEVREQLASLNKEASEDTPHMKEVRNTLHCQIQSLEKDRREKRMERETGMPVAFDNRLAKLSIVEQWPTKRQELLTLIQAGKARQRRYGDVEDIGVRKISSDQEKDIKLGEDALRDMKQYMLMPQEVEEKELAAYVQDVANRIARSSDLTVPIKARLLRSEEVNAFALPGGFLFVNTGLAAKAANESELAGVIAHELAHVSARHGAKLMKRATAASILYSMAQVAVMIATGGIGGIGMYYALQYGFMGLGMILSLELLGVSREFEAEADLLGAQYAWKTGYDTTGFITFFDKMASEKGYVKSASFFRTHPPFLDRILATYSEIQYLPKNPEAVVDTPEFREFKTRLADSLKKSSDEDKKKPSLFKSDPQCVEEPKPEVK